jgi:hypothetical protein
VQEHYRNEGECDTLGLLVRGGLWEADLVLRRMAPCYWPGCASRILRASWFLEKGADWVPLKVLHLHMKRGGKGGGEWTE